MQKYFTDRSRRAGSRSVKVWTAPGPATASTTHGGFDDDRLHDGVDHQADQEGEGLSEEEEERPSSSLETTVSYCPLTMKCARRF